MPTETPKTVQLTDGTVVSLSEYKKSIAIKILPAGFILGGIVGFASKDWNLKGSWKFALGTAVLGTFAAAIVLSWKYNKIDDSYTK